MNPVDDEGHSALDYAILGQSDINAQDHLDAIQALIDAGAALNLRDRAGISPLGHARKMLANALLDDDVTLAFHPGADLTLEREWNGRKLAEAVVALLAAAGAVD
jgi:hypothetical protein